MDFALTQEQRQIRDMVADFVDEEVVPRAAEIDETDEFPADLIEEMAELGLLGMPIPEEYGGAGLDYHAYPEALVEISRGSGGLGTVVAAHVSLACNMVYEFGNEAQREQYLVPMAEGEEIGAFALSEPGAGSDVPAMGTTAEPVGGDAGGGGEPDRYVLDGEKLWISNGSVADTVVVFAKTDPAADGGGISSFIIRPETDDGFYVEGTEDKLGDKGCPTAELRFDEMEIPAERRLGEEGAGFVQALKTLNGGRITIAARSIGAQAALDDALEYAAEREQFDQPISEFQAIQHKLADMDTKIQAARYLMHAAADKKMRGDRYVKEAAQAKLYASEMAREVCNEAIQIHGGYGYTKDFAVERYYRDAKLNEIYEGTSEVLRNTIADQLLD
ncbi:acyl-CoA dehydrogenase family protein [Halosimplex litoreum]|uniref:Acyl-CoA dehydrogenase family protein n=1 Tax=Halosimplex litoreum TaxID=1198301 RepID=A0A7T3G0B4_9EURY|nr:acyl-CoA dehydrogenase family protein [Halosimplex litoreum]QPV63911.1 acyl-CoA dehydrogenase family protein [Halosimplex litoreum]